MASKSLFDHIKAITSEQDPKYWDKLEESDKKTFSNFMIHRFLSMNPDWIEVLSEIQPYTQVLEPKQLYLALIGIIPKGKYYLKYTKGKGENKYEGWLIDLLKQDFQCSQKEVEEYLEILYSTRQGRENIKYICEKYGIDTKEITKLKLKI
jgi:Uma2 family endonuclease